MTTATDAPVTTPSVLLVEDDAEIRTMLKSTLELLFNYRVVTGCDGLEGLVAAAKFQPDVILMDLAMPNMNGIEATHALKAQDATKDIPVIVLSNYAGVLTWRQQAEKAGCARCVEKMLDPEELKQMIEEVLEETAI